MPKNGIAEAVVDVTAEDVVAGDEADVEATAVADVDAAVDVGAAVDPAAAVDVDAAGVTGVADVATGGVTTAGRGSVDTTHALSFQTHQRLLLFS
jgi:hypothetical protein